MKKNILVTAFILFSITLFGQTKSSDNNFNLGVAAFQAGNYEKALAYFTESLNEVWSTNCMVNRAITYYYLGDTCKFCDDLEYAFNSGDTTAARLFKENCATTRIIEKVPDSIKRIYPKAKYLEIRHTKCNPDSTVTLFSRDSKSTWSEDISISYQDASVIVEEMPLFPGGDTALFQFISQNIKYPIKARDAGIQGTVIVTFIIDKIGYIRNVKVISGIGGGCDEEAIRIVKLMPKWKPGTQNGKPVNVKFNVPIQYYLSLPEFQKKRR